MGSGRKDPNDVRQVGKDVDLSEEEQKILDEAIEEQLRAFRAKFGRDPLPQEPIFFDPNKDVPTALEIEDPDEQVLEAMRLAGIAPQFIYAYKKTGLILTEDARDSYPDEILQEYQAAIEEYFDLDAASKRRK